MVTIKSTNIEQVKINRQPELSNTKSHTPTHPTPNTANKRWHVYLLECKDGSFYTGVTNDLDKRMKTHAQGKGSKYVKAKGFKKLLRSKQCESKSESQKAEYQIKQLQKYDKLDWFNQIKTIKSP